MTDDNNFTYNMQKEMSDFLEQQVEIAQNTKITGDLGYITGRKGSGRGEFGKENRSFFITWCIFCLPIFALSLWNLHVAFVVGYGVLAWNLDNIAYVCECRMEQVIETSNPMALLVHKMIEVASANDDSHYKSIEGLRARIRAIEKKLPE